MENLSRRSFAQAAALCLALGAGTTACASAQEAPGDATETAEKTYYGPLQIERFDHLHYIPEDYTKFIEKFEKLLGQEIETKLDNSEWSGSMVAYQKFPIGLEAFLPVYDNKGWTAHVGLTEGPGVASITFKVKDIEVAEKVMTDWGYEIVERTTFDPIFEIIFDTKEDLGLYLELIEYPGDTIPQVDIDK